MSSNTSSPTSSSYLPTAATSGDDLCAQNNHHHRHVHVDEEVEDVEVDEMTAMFSNLLKGGLIKQADLIDNGFHEVSTKIMVDVSVNSDVGRALTASRAARRQHDEANTTKSPTHEVRRTIGKGRGRADDGDGDENTTEEHQRPKKNHHHPSI